MCKSRKHWNTSDTQIFDCPTESTRLGGSTRHLPRWGQQSLEMMLLPIRVA